MKNIFLTVFISKLKNALFGGSTYFFSKFFSPVLAFKTIYKCYYYQYSLKCKFGFGLLKSYLTLGQLTCSDRSKKMSTLHPTVLSILHCSLCFGTPGCSLCSGKINIENPDLRAVPSIMELLCSVGTHFVVGSIGNAQNQEIA